MIQLYVSHIIKSYAAEHQQLIREKYGEKTIDRIVASTHESYKLRRATSRLMLIEICKDLGVDDHILKEIYHTKKGKLKMPKLPYNISISYSGELAICVVSKEQIGIDIEAIKDTIAHKKVKVLETLTHQKIRSKFDFYKRWTRIESIVKMYDNKGLFTLFEKDFFKSTFWTKHIMINKQYLVALSSENEIGKMKKLTIIKIENP